MTEKSDLIFNKINSLLEGNFSEQTPISDRHDETDAVIVGLNMLGEHIAQTTITTETFHKTLDQAPAMIWTADADSLINWNNQTSMQFFGRTILGSVYSEFRSLIHPDDKENIISRLKECLTSRKNIDFEFRIVLNDGTVKWILCRGVPRNSLDGKFEGYIFYSIDIDKQKKSEQVILEAKEEANRANRAKSEFLSSMSHELRTPLNAIYGFGQLISMDDSLSNENQERIEEILKASQHLLGLINEVLDLSKIESGKIDLSLEDVKICPVLEECISLTQAIARTKNIKIDLDCEDSHCLYADKIRLKQIILNLLSNAIKYNNKNGAVVISVSVESLRARISIADTGNGISEQNMKKLFTPFQRLEAEGSEIEGTGIGLTISKKILELMGGRIGAESTEGKGSTFWFELPVSNASDPQAKIESYLKQASPSSSVRKQSTILYIEDNPSNIKLVTQILSRRENILLLIAETPHKGIEAALSSKPDLILLDINLPGMSGYDVLDFIKNNEMLKTTPVAAISANVMPHDVKKGFASGFIDYIKKPIDIPDFVKRIEGILNLTNK